MKVARWKKIDKAVWITNNILSSGFITACTAKGGCKIWSDLFCRGNGFFSIGWTSVDFEYKTSKWKSRLYYPKLKKIVVVSFSKQWILMNNQSRMEKLYKLNFVSDLLIYHSEGAWKKRIVNDLLSTVTRFQKKWNGMLDARHVTFYLKSNSFIL